MTFPPCSLPAAPCSARFQTSHYAAGAGMPALPALKTRPAPPTCCSPARSPLANTASHPTTSRAKRVSHHCTSLYEVCSNAEASLFLSVPLSASELSLTEMRDKVPSLRRLDPGLMPLPDTACGLEWSSLVSAAKAYEGELRRSFRCELFVEI